MHGIKIHGIVTCSNKDEAIHLLKVKNYFPICIRNNNFGILFNKFGKISKIKLSILFNKFSVFLQTGFSLDDCINLLFKQIKYKPLNSMLKEINSSIRAGKTLSQSFKKYINIIPEIIPDMIEIGEISGTLENSMQILSNLFNKEYKLNQKIKSALLYPIILVIVSIIVVIFLLTNVIPVFIHIFKANNFKIPVETIFMINFFNVLKILFPSLFISIFVVFILCHCNKKSKFEFENILFRIPVVNTFYKDIISLKLCRILYSLIKSGIPLDMSLITAAKTISCLPVKNELYKIEKKIENGNRFSESIENERYFSDLLTQFISTGEETGALDTMIYSASLILESELEYKINRIAVMIEPALIIIFGGIVLLITLSILIPILKMISTAI